MMQPDFKIWWDFKTYVVWAWLKSSRKTLHVLTLVPSSHFPHIHSLTPVLPRNVYLISISICRMYFIVVCLRCINKGHLRWSRISSRERRVETTVYTKIHLAKRAELRDMFCPSVFSCFIAMDSGTSTHTRTHTHADTRLKLSFSFLHFTALVGLTLIKCKNI